MHLVFDETLRMNRLFFWLYFASNSIFQSQSWAKGTQDLQGRLSAQRDCMALKVRQHLIQQHIQSQCLVGAQFMVHFKCLYWTTVPSLGRDELLKQLHFTAYYKTKEVSSNNILDLVRLSTQVGSVLAKSKEIKLPVTLFFMLQAQQDSAFSEKTNKQKT